MLGLLTRMLWCFLSLGTVDCLISCVRAIVRYVGEKIQPPVESLTYHFSSFDARVSAAFVVSADEYYLLILRLDWLRLMVDR
ncbi:hypothetical protein DE146DRAFT_639414 [Phaeosphaeria sp. MPI-PUGE-AT-0046c]|nr:hypothetical protein DE146DRAFT_639414 [Phaeosphaeria sp. MPI-PUGE-AT-0046c]